MGSGPADRRGTARLLAVCAVLFGLFFMHGAPATAAAGCHGAMPAPRSPMPHDQSHAAAAPMAHDDAAPDAQKPESAAQPADASAMPGVLCVSTPAHERITLPSPGLVAVTAVVVAAAWMPAALLAAGGRIRRRGPPSSGRERLLEVCVART